MAKFPFRKINGLPEAAQRELWRNFEAVAHPHIETIGWSSNGDVTVSSDSDPWEVMVGGTRLTAVVNLSAALTGATEVDVLVGGVVVTTVTVASGATRGESTVSTVTEPGDHVTLDTTTVGTGSATASAQVKLDRTR